MAIDESMAQGKAVKVSVILAALNAEKHIRQCIASLAEQTLAEAEFLLADAGSEDDTVAIMKEYAGRDERCRVIRLGQANLGEVRDRLIREARGEYILTVNADDYLAPELLTRAWVVAKAKRADVVLLDGLFFSGQSQAYWTGARILPNDKLPLADLRHIRSGAGTLLVSKELMVREKIFFGAQTDVSGIAAAGLALATARNVARLDAKLLRVRCGEGTAILQQLLQMPLSRAEALADLKKELDTRGLLEKNRTGLAGMAVGVLLAWDLDEQRQDWGVFVQAYDALQTRFSEVLNFSEANLGIELHKRVQDLGCYTAEEFYERTYGGLFPPAARGSKVVLYGAGDQGKLLYERIQRDNEWQLIAWVDRQYEQVGFPVTSPEKILDYNFDYVFIAVEKRNTCSAIKDYLASLGVPREKLLHAVRLLGNGSGIAVSVVMIVKDSMPYFARALDSICHQTHKNIEILVVDAASKDGTREYVMQRMAEDPRIRLLEDDKRSTGYANNKGIDEARGDYIGFCEGDDYVDHDMYHRLYEEALAHGRPDIVKMDYDIFMHAPQGEIAIHHESLPPELYGRNLSLKERPQLVYDDVQHWSGIYRADFLRQNRIRWNETPGAAFQDVSFLAQTHILARRELFLHGTGYHYRRDNPGASMFSPNACQYTIWEVEQVMRVLNAHPHEKRQYAWTAFNRIFQAFAYWYGMGYYFGNPLPDEVEQEELRSKVLAFFAGMDMAWHKKMRENEMLALFLDDLPRFRSKAIGNIWCRLEQHRRFVRYLLAQSAIVVCGAEKNGLYVAMCMTSNRYQGRLLIADSNPGKQGDELQGYPVFDFSGAVREAPEAVYVLAVSQREKGMREQLLRKGVRTEQIISSIPLNINSAMMLKWEKLG